MGNGLTPIRGAGLQCARTDPAILRGVTAIVALVIGAGAYFLATALSGELFYNHFNDSPSYIEAARNFLESGHFKAFPYGLQHDLELQYIKLWPPGYPLVVALASKAGVAPEDAAVFISNLALILLPLAVLFASTAILPMSWALAVTVSFMLSPYLLRYGNASLADALFLVIATASLGVFLRAHGNSLFLLLSGILAGMCLAVRNAGLALIAAELLALFMYFIDRRGKWLSRLSSFLSGIFIPAGTLIAYNYFVLDELFPYKMPRAATPLAEVIAEYLVFQAYDLIGSFTVAQIVGDLWPLTLPLLICLLLWSIIVLPSRRGASGYWNLDYNAMAFSTLALYVLVGATMIVLSKSRYAWGEDTLGRLTMQYSWVIFSLACAGVLAIEHKGIRKYAQSLVICMLLASTLLKGYSAWITYSKRSEDARVAELFAKGDSILPVQFPTAGALLAEYARSLDFLVTEIPRDAVVLSNDSKLLRIEYGFHARSINLDVILKGDLGEMRRLVEFAAFATAAQKPIHLIAFYFGTPPGLAAWREQLAAKLGEHFVVAEAQRPFLLHLRYRDTRGE